MKTFAVGDIHGAYKVLIQCLKRAKFDYKQDRLYTVERRIICKEYEALEKEIKISWI